MPGLQADTRAESAAVDPRKCGVDRDGCVHCGGSQFAEQVIIDDELAGTWELTARERAWFDLREGHHCANCGMSLRVRMLLWTLQRITPKLAGLRILHVNQINHLAAALHAAEVIETTYRLDAAPGTEIDGRSNQDLMNLTFPDASFDLVVHSETLEHVEDPERALAEVRRVLRPGGRQIYTVPLLHERRSRRRASRAGDGTVTHLLPPSHHGLEAEFLVLWELGGDFLTGRQKSIEALFYDDFERNPTVFAVVEKA
ncbi:MAG: class I SAM-dependent methyltransferase [Acidobacteriota bacterium]